MGFSRRRRASGAGEPRSYVGKHQARRRLGTASLAGSVAAIVVAMVAVTVVILLNSAPPDSRGTEAPTTESPRPTEPPQRSASTVFAVSSFQGGLKDWWALPGTLFSRGDARKKGVSYARIQRDATNQPGTDPSTGAAMLGIGAHVLPSAQPGMRVQTTVRVRATKPGVTVVVQLSEREGNHRFEGGEARLTLPDTHWRSVGADHRVVRAGASIDLEIWALALGPDDALYVDRLAVTSP
jgi:hypothetical protein